MFWRLDALLGFLLKCMNDPEIIRKVDSVNDAKRIAPKRQGDFEDAGTQAVHGFRDVRLAAFGSDRERRQNGGLRTSGERLKVLQRRLDPRDRPSFSGFSQGLTATYFMLSYVTT